MTVDVRGIDHLGFELDLDLESGVPRADSSNVAPAD